MHRLFHGYEFLKAGLYTTIGVAVAIQFSHKSDRAQFADTVNAAEVVIPQLASPFSGSGPVALSQSKPMNSVGLPASGYLRVFDGYLCAYDRRNRIPLWVMEHLNPTKLMKDSTVAVDRRQFEFYEDLAEFEMFRSTNADYLGSGYDRGHMAAAGNHRFEHSAMGQTFILSNIAPQVGVGFNRHAWNDLEKYVRAIARKANNVVVVTGPLFLPRVERGKKIVTYEVIGPNNVAVPTHFFKAVAIQETEHGPWRSVAWVLPNAQLPEKVNLKQFQVPLSAVERNAGLKIFPNLPS
ncbi:Endonuclease G mitochondrial [Fasciola hepatica]|uniref:Endonuclease n=1 Tax=Fasciola hepatica TaxID=6192 RepID=A0A4E0RNC9_FASHE|nr:Endonuclease G mitochondrial [Fasciola hepatica]